MVAGWVLARRTGDYPWLQVSAAMLCAFLLFNKVYSPQYVLWLLPFFVLLRVRWGWWASYLAVDVLLYVGLFRWYYDITQGGDYGLAKQAAVLGVWGKAVLLALLYVVFLLSSPSIRPGPSSGSEPPPARASTSGPRSSAWSSTPPAGSSPPRPAGPAPGRRPLRPQHVPHDQRQTPGRRGRGAAPRAKNHSTSMPLVRCRGTRAAAGPRPGLGGLPEQQRPPPRAGQHRQRQQPERVLRAPHLVEQQEPGDQQERQLGDPGPARGAISPSQRTPRASASSTRHRGDRR